MDRADSDISTWELPRRLGRYTLIEQLAKGGMAVIFVARRDGDREPCVLKLLRRELEDQEVIRKRFHREAHVMALLEHPHIVRTFSAGYEDGTFCIATELVRGVSVQQIMSELRTQSRPMPPSLGLAIGLAVLDALAYAHQLTDANGRNLELVHRDLSPRNLLVAFDGSIRVIDFGIARGQVDRFQTAPGTIVGSLAYMSPEQALGESIDHRSDLYSLAVVFYEMLTGRFLIAQSDALIALIAAIVNEVPPRLSSVQRGIPGAFDGVMRKALAKKSGERFQSAAEFRSALLTASGKVGVSTREELAGFLRAILPAEEQRLSDMLERARNLHTDGLSPLEPMIPENTTSAQALSLPSIASISASDALRDTDPPISSAASARTEDLNTLMSTSPGLAVPTDREYGGDEGDEGEDVLTDAGTLILLPTFEPEITQLDSPILEMPGDQVPLAKTPVRRKRRRDRSSATAPILVGLALVLAAAVAFNPRRHGAPAQASSDAPAERLPVPAAVPQKSEARPLEHPATPSDGGAATPTGERSTRSLASTEPARTDLAKTDLAKADLAKADLTRRKDPTGARDPGHAAQTAADALPPETEETRAAAGPEVAPNHPYADLARILLEVKRKPGKDSRRYSELLEAISRASSDLPTERRRAVESELRTAEIAYDLDALTRALDGLIQHDGRKDN